MEQGTQTKNSTLNTEIKNALKYGIKNLSGKKDSNNPLLLVFK